jgi:membrane protease YdiL (CAAX protease family)
MAPQTARYLELVHLGRNDWWRYALGVFVIALFWLGLGYLPYLYLADGPLGPMADFAAVNFSIFMMLAGLALAVKGVHRRPLLSLVTPHERIDWRRIARGAAVWAAFGVLAGAVEHWLYPGRYYLSFDAHRFFPFAALVLVLTPIQCAAEELVFRGYVMQGLALVTRSPALIAIASSLIFTAPHLLNPEVERHGALLMGALYFAIGMVLATVVLRDGRLELALGLHAANNVFLALVANYEGSALMTESIFTARALDPWFALVTLAGGGLAFHWWVFRGRGE